MNKFFRFFLSLIIMVGFFCSQAATQAVNWKSSFDEFSEIQTTNGSQFVHSNVLNHFLIQLAEITEAEETEEDKNDSDEKFTFTHRYVYSYFSLGQYHLASKSFSPSFEQGAHSLYLFFQVFRI